VDSITVFLILDLRFAILGVAPEGVFALGGAIGDFSRSGDEIRRAKELAAKATTTDCPVTRPESIDLAVAGVG
jgi:hypothetical protein